MSKLLDSSIDQSLKSSENCIGLEAYRLAFEAAGRFFESNKNFPLDKLIDEIVISSKYVYVKIEEAWSDRENTTKFINRLREAESYAIETLTWIDFCIEQKHIKADLGKELQDNYIYLIQKLRNMININHNCH